ncbi:hypothetical protein [uncultured Roseibium sp.]|uniref:hypothetical protein n=1 Tax=uncultured Roseibium sp. TaxID=1936171 RepID=UPI002622F1B1|nr:hypothetical protein [uncultured Roseibium sp.]
MSDENSNDQLPMIQPDPYYDPAEIILVGMNISGIKSSSAADVKIDTGGNDFSRISIQLVFAPNRQIALIKSYIYEGNHYELAKPKLMVVSGEGEDLPGNYVPKDRPMKFWRMNKLTRTTEISVEDGLLETLILEANLPGRRSPNSYAANMQMAHRSGRLNS